MSPVRGYSRTAQLLAFSVVLVLGCANRDQSGRELTFSGSAVGLEAEILERQFARFERTHPPWHVQLRATPDAADERRQLYVQWLNAHAERPDVLQLDVIWTAEFAAAGWILPLDRFDPAPAEFFPATVEANTWNGRLYALPWFVDVGLLYWRTDLMATAPATFTDLAQDATAARNAGLPYGMVWQGARYEGLVTCFLEFLGGFGGTVVDEAGRVAVDSEAAVRALTFMRDMIWSSGVVPPAILTWQEEQTRFAFQNGRSAFMRNWPYAYPLLEREPDSRVAQRFSVAPMPASASGTPTAALGGSQLALNARSGHAEAGFELIRFLTEPDQMLERAQLAGQWPARPALYGTEALGAALSVDASTARRVIEQARPRPVTPIYSQLSDILQVHLHRSLSRQEDPRVALNLAAAGMRTALARAGLTAEATE